MNESRSSSPFMRVLIVLLVIGVLAGGTMWFLADQNTLQCDGKSETFLGVAKRETLQGGEALGVALCMLMKETKSPDQAKAKQYSERALVAQAILDNFRETRANAARWSGVYWGFTFIAAALSALAALILKLETLIRNEHAKKDVAAVLSVVAALLMTISTSGDFQRKWQANRVAAAELEHIGYEFLGKDAADARSYLEKIGQVLYRRHLAIVGGTEQREPSAAPPPPQAAPPKTASPKTVPPKAAPPDNKPA